MKRVSRNLLAIVGSDVGRRIIGFFTVAYLARKLGTGDFGVINIGFTVLTYAVMAGAGGLGSYGARETAKGSSDVVNSILSIRLITAFLTYVAVAVIVVAGVSNILVVQVVLIACIALFPNALLLEWFFQGREAMGMLGVGRLISAVVYFSLVMFFVRAPEDVLWVAVASVAGDVIATAVTLGVYRMRYDMPFRFRLKGGWGIFKNSFGIGLGSILAHFSINLPTIVIGIVLTTSDVGLYSAAQKMVFFLLVIDRMLGTVLLPAAARFMASSADALAKNLSFALRWIFILGAPIAIGGTLLGKRIIALVYGSQYLAAGEVFQIFIWYFFFTMIHTIYTTGLIAIGEEKRYSRVMVASAVVNVITIVLGTKFFGLPGAAAAVAGSEGVTLYLMRYEFKKFVRTNLRSALIPVAVSAVAMSMVVVMLPAVHVLIAIAAGGAVYVAALFATKGLTAAHMRELKGRLA